MNQSAELRSSLGFFATAHLFPEGYQPYKNEVYLLPTELDRHSACIPPGTDSECSGHPFPSLKVVFTARTQGAFSQRSCGESPRAKLQRVSSEDRRSPVLGQAVFQSAEMRSALEFFATAQSFRERTLESIN